MMDLTRHRCFLVSGMAIAATILLSWTISAAANEKTNTKEGSSQKAEVKKPGKVQPAGKPMTMSIFLDRLMMAESGGNDFARNRRSTATGSYQFIVSTFLSVARRHFPAETSKLSRTQILALRTDRKFARKAAEAYTKDNAAHLAAAGHKPTFTNLRLAFLLGPGGAKRILSAPPKAKVGVLLGRAVMRANPFMSGMTASDLVARAARDIATDPRSTAGIKAGKLAKRGRRPRIRVRCNLARPSCKRWLALKRRRLARTASKANRAKRKAKN
ncbi:MAG: hypothetical protein AAGD43_28430 [Pseudomonadota bacterium]